MRKPGSKLGLEKAWAWRDPHHHLAKKRKKTERKLTVGSQKTEE